jgi:probable addiction module antidote protein
MTALETLPIDLAPYYDREHAQAELLNDALATGETGYIKSALGVVAHAHGMSSICGEIDARFRELDRTLGRDGKRTLDTLTKLLSALGFRLTISPARAVPLA